MKFRDKAIEYAKTLSTNDYSLNITNNSGWLTLFACFILMAAVFLWSILGEVSTQVTGKGIILAENGKIFDVVSPTDNSKIIAIKYPIGKLVKTGDILVELEQTELASQISVSTNYINQLKEEYDTLKAQEKDDIVELVKIIDEKDNILKEIIGIETSAMKFLEDLEVKQSDMLKKGITNRLEYSKTLIDLTNTKSTLQNSFNQLLETKIQLNNRKLSWVERLRNLKLSIQNEEFKLNGLKERYKLSKQLTSPINGIVIGVQSSFGEILDSGRSIITLATMGEGLDVIAYFSPEKGKKIKPGMKTLISPVNIKPEEYGSLIGEVFEVAAFSTNHNEMMSILKNESLVKNLAQDQAPIMVYIRIKSDKKSYSGFKWSNSEGPSEHITPGTLSEVKITVKKQKPITLLIPTLKKVFM